MQFNRLFLLLLIFQLPGAPAAAQLDSLLSVLDTELDRRGEYLAGKEEAIAKIDAARSATGDDEVHFALLLEKVAALESFSFDRAYAAVRELRELAERLGNKEKIQIAKLREAFIFLSAGLFNEALDSLNTIPVSTLPDSVKTEYFATRARTHFDLAGNYAVTSLSEQAHELGLADLDSALHYAPEQSVHHLSLAANRAMMRGNPVEGIRLYHQIRTHPGVTTRWMAKEHGAAAILFGVLNQPDSARLAVVRSAIADERTVTREAISLVRLARYVYEMGDYERSARYIRIGLENANFFDARHRKMEVLDILPLIEDERQQLLRSQRRQFALFAIIVSFLLLLAIWLIRRTILQNRELTERRQALLSAYEQLRRNNTALRESQRIKEQYIGYFFQTNTKFINAAKKIIDRAAKAVYAADFNEAKFQLKSFNAKQQNKQLLQDFDQVFLELFPNFLQDFQALFPPGERIQEEGQDELAPEVRIFALMRLGIRNNDTIAKILGYSVNTIYAYRSKVRGRSFLTKEKFNEAVMNISSTGKTRPPGEDSE